jgi:hypothetical protein
LALAGDLDGPGEHVLIRVADGNDLDRGDLHQAPQVAFAVPTCADEADPSGLLCGKGRRQVGGGG